MTDRLRGYGLQKRNARILQREPLCRRCKERGFIREAEVIDHEVPLALGGKDTDDNLRPLCKPCHVDVTAEQFGRRVKPRINTDGWPE